VSDDGDLCRPLVARCAGAGEVTGTKRPNGSLIVLQKQLPWAWTIRSTYSRRLPAIPSAGNACEKNDIQKGE